MIKHLWGGTTKRRIYKTGTEEITEYKSLTKCNQWVNPDLIAKIDEIYWKVNHLEKVSIEICHDCELARRSE